MIKEVTIRNFKRFRNETFALHPEGVTLLAGGNNSGKSTILQALAVWEFCRTVVEAEKGRGALNTGYHGHGIPISAENFAPLAVPAPDHLWTNLKQGYEAGQPNAAYTLRIGCKWDEAVDGAAPVERSLTFGLHLAHDRIYLKPLESNLVTECGIPRLAYLPPFAGISAHEEKLSPAAQQRLIGRGLAGATLRNFLHELSRQSAASWEEALAGRKRLRGAERRQFFLSDPWCQLSEVLERVFRCGLRVQPFNDRYHTTLNVDVFRGNWQGARFVKFPKYKPRDIMVEGSGFLQWLSVYALAVTPDVNVLLLDEPDAHLHPSLQAHLMDRLRSLARENSKQVLLATHSTEILRHVDHRCIYELSTRGHRYLTVNEQRVGLFEGLGSEYAPKIDQLKKSKRVVFAEGTFDEAILRAFAEKINQALPENLVFWLFNGAHPQRRVLFEQLRGEIPGLEGLSLRDRDELALAQVNANLVQVDHADRNGLRCRTLRRRHLENYLLQPVVIARATNQPEATIVQFLADHWGLAVGADFTASNCAPGLLDARGKEILAEGVPARDAEPAKPSVEEQFGCARHEIAGAFTEQEVADDIKTLIGELRTMCQGVV